MDERNQLDLYSAFENADTVILKKYVNNLDKLPIVEPSRKITSINVGSNVSLFHVDRLVYDKKESIHDKLVTVFSALQSDDSNSIIMIIQGCKEHVDFYIGNVIKSDKDSNILTKKLESTGNALRGVIEGNFPGTAIHKIDIAKKEGQNNKTVKSVIESCFNSLDTVVAVSGIASLRNQNGQNNEMYVQGMEKLVDSMRGKEYSAIYIADVVNSATIEELCAEYEDIYSQLSPFKQSVKTFSKNTAETETKSFIKGVVDTTNESLAKSVSHGKTHSITRTDSLGGSVSAGVDFKVVKTQVTATYQHSKAEGESTTETEGTTETTGKAKSLTEQNAVGNALMKGQGESLQVTYDNRSVITLLERIDEMIKRLRSCENFGLYDSCVYFLSGKYEYAISAASAYRSLIRGENSYFEASAINTWSDKESISLIAEYLKRFYHPLFAMGVSGSMGLTTKEGDIIPVSPASLLSGEELAYQFSFPKKALNGVPVVECAEFGRSITTYDGNPYDGISIGHIWHMNKEEESEVKLSLGDMTSHMFITGSTGKGKSNAIYVILDELITGKRNDNINFLVIEPAKGEYKRAFNRAGVHVYGTNKKETDLLRINPFSFPDKIHVLEHIDRLVEVFNACWPMYAAMPAVLKDSIERAYIKAGWNLRDSECKYKKEDGNNLYPSFCDVLKMIDAVMSESKYSSDSKGDYIGALSTRVRSLTNGINGQVFTSREIGYDELFDSRVIVDLSRVGSTETKALIMGLLVIKMQEYRISAAKETNAALKHITVLEEAHNLMKRTSFNQSSDSANLTGKSVEMIANSIAEMRTYGEGFIIADQAPELLDLSVIRNTNTKIIFGLPDMADRELVGKSAALNEDQISELSKLRTGVAAIYQSSWIEPVLCKFKEYKPKSGMPSRQRADALWGEEENLKALIEYLLLPAPRKLELDSNRVAKLEKNVYETNVSADTRINILKYIKETDPERIQQLREEIVYDIFNVDNAVMISSADEGDIQSWYSSMVSVLEPNLHFLSQVEQDKILAIITKKYAEQMNTEDAVEVRKALLELVASRLQTEGNDYDRIKEQFRKH